MFPGLRGERRGRGCEEGELRREDSGSGPRDLQILQGLCRAWSGHASGRPSRPGLPSLGASGPRLQAEGGRCLWDQQVLGRLGVGCWGGIALSAAWEQPGAKLPGVGSPGKGPHPSWHSFKVPGRVASVPTVDAPGDMTCCVRREGRSPQDTPATPLCSKASGLPALGIVLHPDTLCPQLTNWSDAPTPWGELRASKGNGVQLAQVPSPPGGWRGRRRGPGRDVEQRTEKATELSQLSPVEHRPLSAHNDFLFLDSALPATCFVNTPSAAELRGRGGGGGVTGRPLSVHPRPVPGAVSWVPFPGAAWGALEPHGACAAQPGG